MMVIPIYFKFNNIIYLYSNLVVGHISSYLQNDKFNNHITWCTLNAPEQSKCLNLSAAINKDRQRFNPKDFMELMCKQVGT